MTFVSTMCFTSIRPTGGKTFSCCNTLLESDATTFTGRWTRRPATSSRRVQSHIFAPSVFMLMTPLHMLALEKKDESDDVVAPMTWQWSSFYILVICSDKKAVSDWMTTAVWAGDVVNSNQYCRWVYTLHKERIPHCSAVAIYGRPM